MQKIVLYITSKTMRQTIDHTIKENGLVTLDCNNQIGNAISLEDFMSRKGFLLGDNDVDYMVIDLAALVDEEEKIIDSIGGFLTMHEAVRIIIVSLGNVAGDQILSDLFAIGVRNFAVGEDYVVIKQSLEKCLSQTGMSYKEAIDYKDVKENPKERVKKIREVNKVMIGIAGSQPRIGCTHNAIIISNQLKRMGFAVAYLEMNHSGALQMIRRDERINMVDSMFYTSRNIDYYPDCDELLLKKILEDKVYNFLVLDFGCYRDCEIHLYNRCHVKMAIGNVQAWEINFLVDFWYRYDDEARKQINFYINFLEDEKDRRALEKIFKTKFRHIRFVQDPFEAEEFPGLTEILEDYLPEAPQKRKLFGFGRKVSFF